MNKDKKTETDSEIQRTNRWLLEGRNMEMSEIGEED